MGDRKDREQKVETPFTDYVKGKISESQFGEITGKGEGSLKEYQKAVDKSKKALEKIPVVSDETVTDVNLSWKQDGRIKTITQRRMRKTEYEIKPNKRIRFIMNFASCKVYYDLETDEFWLYVISPDQKKLERRILLENHDIENFTDFGLAENKGKEWIEKKAREQKPELYLTKKRIRNIRKFAEKIDLIEFEKFLVEEKISPDISPENDVFLARL